MPEERYPACSRLAQETSEKARGRAPEGCCVIRYHGGPCTPLEAALELWSGRHALVSFAYPGQMAFVAKHAHSFAMDNGAFSAWQQGIQVNWDDYVTWIAEYAQHPGFDHALIPDVIDGSEKDNDELLSWWRDQDLGTDGVPVWHLHESLERLSRLVMKGYRTVAFGSSGEFSEPGTHRWWGRMSEAMDIACDSDGRPLCRLWGLRQMDPTIFSHVPYSFVDSASISRNSGMEKGKPGKYKSLSPKQAALMMAFDADRHKSAERWAGSSGVQENMEFY